MIIKGNIYNQKGLIEQKVLNGTEKTALDHSNNNQEKNGEKEDIIEKHKADE